MASPSGPSLQGRVGISLSKLRRCSSPAQVLPAKLPQSPAGLRKAKRIRQKAGSRAQRIGATYCCPTPCIGSDRAGRAGPSPNGERRRRCPPTRRCFFPDFGPMGAVGGVEATMADRVAGQRLESLTKSMRSRCCGSTGEKGVRSSDCETTSRRRMSTKSCKGRHFFVTDKLSASG